MSDLLLFLLIPSYCTGLFLPRCECSVFWRQYTPSQSKLQLYRWFLEPILTADDKQFTVSNARRQPAVPRSVLLKKIIFRLAKVRMRKEEPRSSRISFTVSDHWYEFMQERSLDKDKSSNTVATDLLYDVGTIAPRVGETAWIEAVVTIIFCCMVCGTIA